MKKHTILAVLFAVSVQYAMTGRSVLSNNEPDYDLLSALETQSSESEKDNNITTVVSSA